jgi:hypothetical protein
MPGGRLHLGIGTTSPLLSMTFTLQLRQVVRVHRRGAAARRFERQAVHGRELVRNGFVPGRWCGTAPRGRSISIGGNAGERAQLHARIEHPVDVRTNGSVR